MKMARSPQFKVYDKDGEYLASCHHLEHAAMIVAGIGADGTTIRNGHSKKMILWTEGSEDFPASESYDGVAVTADNRMYFRKVGR